MKPPEKERKMNIKPLAVALVTAPLFVACGVPVVGNSPAVPEATVTATVTSEPTPEFDEADIARLSTRMTWNKQSEEDQDAICWLFNMDRDLAMSSFAEGADFDPYIMDAAEDLFEEEC